MDSINELPFADLLGITWLQASSIVLATALMYLFLLALLRTLGQRITANLSTYDMAAIVIVGAIAGRTTLGHTPTLAGGFVALVTLFVLRAIFGVLQLSPRGGSLINNPPIVVMAGNTIFEDELEHAHISTEQLWMALRLAGIRNDDEIATVILEPNGQFSVLKRGVPVDPQLLDGVSGAGRIDKSLIGERANLEYDHEKRSSRASLLKRMRSRGRSSRRGSDLS